MAPWVQVYDPFNNAILSTLVALVPIALLLAMIASGRIKAHVAALIALAVAIAVAIYAFTMPWGMALRAAGLGVLSGMFPIGWIILNVLFLYRLTVEKGWFAIIQGSIANVIAVNSGTVTSGLAQTDVVALAVAGQGPFRKAGATKQLRVIAKLRF